MTFSAILFDPRDGSSTKVEVRPIGSTLEIVGGAEPLRVDSAKCTLAAGGWDKGAIQITWTMGGANYALTSNDPEAHKDLSRIPVFEAALRSTRKIQVRTRASGGLGMTLLAVLTVLPILVVLALYVFRGAIIDAVLKRIPPSVDVEVGKMFEGDLAKSTTAETAADAEATRVLGLIVARLTAREPAATAANPGFTFRIRVERNQEVNAFAVPGGLIVVYTGLIKEAGSAEEVAGVLAHEMTHVTGRHSMRQMIYAAGLLPLASMIVGDQGPAGLVRDFGQLAGLKFSRTQEEEADQGAFERLVEGSISPDGLATFFDRLGELGGAPPAFLSSHPSSEGRAAKIRERLKALPEAPIEKLPIDWRAVKDSLR